MNLKSERSKRDYLFLDNIFSTKENILLLSEADTFWLFAFREALKCLDEAPESTGVTFIGVAIIFCPDSPDIKYKGIELYL